jgi:hypothetical protein
MEEEHRVKRRNYNVVEPWQVYAARCKRLDREEAKVVPWWATLSKTQCALFMLAELAILSLAAHFIK